MLRKLTYIIQIVFGLIFALSVIASIWTRSNCELWWRSNNSYVDSVALYGGRLIIWRSSPNPRYHIHSSPGPYHMRTHEPPGLDDTWFILLHRYCAPEVFSGPYNPSELLGVSLRRQFLGARFQTVYIACETAQAKSFPLWWISVISSLPLLPWLGALRRRIVQRSRKRKGFCPSCGYDLRASPNRCPECGKRVEDGTEKRWDQKRG